MEGDPPIPGYPSWPVSTTGALRPTPGTTCTGDCPHGADCHCVHTITAHWVMPASSMIYAGGHCHAPSCIDIELYRNDTGTPQLLCRQASRYGQGHVQHDKFDEKGYLVLPPCLWGDARFGLEEPPDVSGHMLHTVKTSNATYGHHGEMAWQQMYYV